MKHLGDITKINWETIPPVDVVTGGSPCQDLSVAGKRAGLAGERSGLYMEQIRCVRELRHADELRGRTGQLIRPRYMVWENVPGAFSSNGGEDFRAVLEEAARVVQPDAVIPRPSGKWSNSGAILGDGWSLAWRVHDAQFWGVPQRRRRISLVCDFGGLSAPEILFERKGVSGDSEPGGAQRKEVTGGTGKSTESSVWCLQGNGIDRADTAGCNGKGWREDVCYTLNTIDRPAVYDARGNGDGKTVCTLTGDHQNRVTDYTAIVTSNGYDVADTLDASYYKGTGARNGKERTVVCVGNGQTNQSIDDKAGALNTMHDQQAVMVQEVAHTLKAKSNCDFRDDSETYHIQNSVVRRLTPLECERLQSYPDGWTKLDPIDDMNDATFLFWQNVLFEQAKRELKVRLGDGRKWEIWHYVTPKSKSFDNSREADADGGYWENTHKPYRHKTKDQMIRWYNKSFCENSDSVRYKALGNSIALPFWFWLLRRISAQYYRPATLGSLFDGIGGFPLCWERCNGKGTALWASEIEEFPIAVTRTRFGEEQ